MLLPPPLLHPPLHLQAAQQQTQRKCRQMRPPTHRAAQLVRKLAPARRRQRRPVLVYPQVPCRQSCHLALRIVPPCGMRCVHSRTTA